MASILGRDFFSPRSEEPARPHASRAHQRQRPLAALPATAGDTDA
jgi:hypothetical protein